MPSDAISSLNARSSSEFGYLNEMFRIKEERVEGVFTLDLREGSISTRNGTYTQLLSNNVLSQSPSTETQHIKKEDKSNRMNESFDRLMLEEDCSVGEVEWQDGEKLDGNPLAPRLFVVNPRRNEG